MLATLATGASAFAARTAAAMTALAVLAGTPHGHSFQAKSVAFDLTPFPCPVKKPHPPKDHHVSPGSGAG